MKENNIHGLREGARAGVDILKHKDSVKRMKSHAIIKEGLKRRTRARRGISTAVRGRKVTCGNVKRGRKQRGRATTDSKVMIV